MDEHAAEQSPRGVSAPEYHHTVRTSDGSIATLVTGLRPLVGRRDRMRIRRLARRRMELEHPALVGIRAVGEQLGQPYLLTDPYPSRTFADVIENEAPLDPERLLTMLAPVAEALDLAHRRGLVHRAFAANSLLLAPGDRLMLDSFAILAGGSGPDKSANIQTFAELIARALDGGPGDGALDGVLAGGRSTNTSSRPASATALLGRLTEALEPQEAPHAIVPPPAPARPPAQARPKRRVATAAAVVVAAGCGALAAAVIDPFGAEEPAQPTRASDTAALERLSARRAMLRGELSGAYAPEAQAAAATALAEVYRAAAGDIPQPLAGGARDAAAAYSDLAVAAEAGDATAFDDARERVAAAEGQVAGAPSR